MRDCMLPEGKVFVAGPDKTCSAEGASPNVDLEGPFLLLPSEEVE